MPIAVGLCGVVEGKQEGNQKGKGYADRYQSNP